MDLDRCVASEPFTLGRLTVVSHPIPSDNAPIAHRSGIVRSGLPVLAWAAGTRSFGVVVVCAGWLLDLWMVASPSSFLVPDAWHGGWYELAVMLGPRSDRRLLDAASWVWSRSDLDGPYGSRSVEAADQKPAEITIDNVEHLYGVAHIPGWVPSVCGSIVIREDGGSDWFNLGLPLGALAAAEPRVGGYPFQDPPDVEDEWSTSLDDWLAEIALGLQEAVPFDIALIGFEVSGENDLLASLIAEGRSTFAYIDAGGYHRSQP